MVSGADAVGLLVIVGANTAIAALLTRLFRVQLATDWGSAVFAVVFVPLAQVAAVLVLGGIGLGPDLGTPTAVVGVTIAVPFALGVAIDVFWMPAPEEVELPDRLDA